MERHPFQRSSTSFFLNPLRVAREQGRTRGGGTKGKKVRRIMLKLGNRREMWWRIFNPIFRCCWEGGGDTAYGNVTSGYLLSEGLLSFGQNGPLSPETSKLDSRKTYSGRIESSGVNRVLDVREQCTTFPHISMANTERVSHTKHAREIKWQSKKIILRVHSH